MPCINQKTSLLEIAVEKPEMEGIKNASFISDVNLNTSQHKQCIKALQSNRTR